MSASKMNSDDSQQLSSRRLPTAAVRRATFAHGSSAPRALIRPASMSSHLNIPHEHLSNKDIDENSQPKPGIALFQRWMIAREICDTEATYLNGLKALKDVRNVSASEFGNNRFPFRGKNHTTSISCPCFPAELHLQAGRKRSLEARGEGEILWKR
jgi:hypothetical protein